MKLIKICRNCKSLKLKFLFSLGKLSFTGKFSKHVNKDIPKDFINLIMCKKCKLIQLDRNFDKKYLYGPDYGYRSGINKTMTKHLSSITNQMESLVNLKKNDYVLDIASNDGTLLNSYKKRNIIKVGIDPILKKYNSFYKNTRYKIPNFFSLRAIKNNKIKNKFKVITACAVFYDMEDPNKFLQDISKIIEPNGGIFYLEFQDLLSIIKYNLFDTICHEHLEYYSLKIVKKMLKNNDLKLLDVNKNKINGGSLGLIIGHHKCRYKVKNLKVNKIIKEEKYYSLENQETFVKFFKKIIQLKIKLNNLIIKIKKNNKIIHGYGASTKGNVLLQFFKLGKKQIKLVADRNPDKDNLFTPGTKIKIISEKKSRSQIPDYYLVLPWHFKNEILKRESKIIKKGTKFIFPLPTLKVY